MRPEEEKPAGEKPLPTAIADIIPDPIIIFDLGGKIVYVNHALLKETSREQKEFIGKHITEIGPLFSPAPLEAIGPGMKECLEKGSVGPYELPIRMPNGREGTVSFIASLMKNAGGNPKNVLMLMKDISETKKLISELERRTKEAEESKQKLERAYKELTTVERSRTFTFILLKDVFEPLLKECGRWTKRKVRDRVKDLGWRLPLARGMRIGYDGSVVLDEVLIRKVLGGKRYEEAVKQITSTFSEIMDACDPIIRADIGDERVTATVRRLFSSLFERPDVSTFRSDLTSVVPDGVEIPREYILLEPKRSYLVEERKPVHAFRIFSEAVRYGSEGLCITTLHPDDAKREYGLGEVTAIWLSKHSGISPASLGILRDTITGFIEKPENSIVLLDGLEYLITTNGFELTLKFLHDLMESITLNRSRLIVPVSPAALGARELALLERHTEPIEIVEEE